MWSEREDKGLEAPFGKVRNVRREWRQMLVTLMSRGGPETVFDLRVLNEFEGRE